LRNSSARENPQRPWNWTARGAVFFARCNISTSWAIKNPPTSSTEILGGREGRREEVPSVFYLLLTLRERSIVDNAIYI